ncbi:MAG: prepilin-type N-terminal cleavage/methylation domain-containing protein [Candidatus Eisenbacteria bacterium]
MNSPLTTPWPTRRPRARVRTRRSGGFTLIEVLVALMIFATGLLALALCVPMATKRVVKAGSQTRASSLASETAEELLTIPYGDGSLTAGTHDDPSNPYDGVYYVRWVVEDDAPSLNCKRVTVKVARGSASQPAEARLVIVTAQSGG